MPGVTTLVFSLVQSRLSYRLAFNKRITRTCWHLCASALELTCHIILLLLNLLMPEKMWNLDV